jgi:membrane protein
MQHPHRSRTREDPAPVAKPAARTGEPAAQGGGEDRPGDEVPSRPGKLPAGSWLAAAKRTATEYREDFLSDRAAALTYYGVMSIFPALLVLVSLLGLIGKSATQPLINSLTSALPPSVKTIFTNAVTHLQGGHAAAGLVAIVAIVLGLWSASGYVAAFMRASNAIYDVPEGRPIWKTVPTRLGITLAVLVLLVVSAVMVVVTGGLAQRVGSAIGLGSAAVTAWDIAKWPVLVIIVSLMFAILYWASPNAKQDFRWISPGGLLAVILWLIASGLFAVYIANFGHYNKVYGSLAGVVIFLVWMWISNVAVLLGAEFNAELQRERAIAGGAPPDEEPFAELRDDRKLRKMRRKKARRAQTRAPVTEARTAGASTAGDGTAGDGRTGAGTAGAGSAQPRPADFGTADSGTGAGTADAGTRGPQKPGALAAARRWLGTRRGSRAG